FPAGIVKPGADPDSIAVSETLAETGVHAGIREHLGRRVHPLTGVVCEYLLCDYLTGEARNADALENLDVAWVQIATLAKFIPWDAVYQPILEALEESRDRADD